MFKAEAATEEDFQLKMFNQPSIDYSKMDGIAPTRDTINSEFWNVFFLNSPVYRGWHIKADEDGRWWCWDGRTIGSSASEADMRRACEIVRGRL